MKHLLGGITVAVLGIATILAVPFASLQNVAASSVNNFSITSYDINYDLSRDAANRSVLKTTETIVAQFPEYDQNHGIERMLPTQYNGHSTSLQIDSITGQDDNKLDFSTDSQSNYDVLRIGDADRYVHGTQVYKIVYTQRDVTRFYQDTNKDEWYWDTNGTQWNVPIERLNVTINLSDDVASNMQGTPFCYQGENGSTFQCLPLTTKPGVYTISATNLSARENVSVAFGFTPGTFAQYEPSLSDRIAAIWGISIFVTGVIAFIVFVLMTVLYYRKKNRTKELHTIVVQYIPPRNTSVTVASQVVTTSGSTFAAQLIDFAVRHFIAIIETKPKGTWSLAEYDISVLKDPAGLLEEEREILSDMFGVVPKVGDRMSLTTLRSDMAYHKRLIDNSSKLKKLIEGPYALRAKLPATSKFFYRWAIVLGIVGVVTFSIPLLIVAAIVGSYGFVIRPLTDTGLEIRRYLLGLSRYIKAAETERLAFFQAPDTAQKIGEQVDVNNPGQILKLYERVLPYAILFGYEKQWTKQLEQFYQAGQSSPDWYVGSNGFHAGLFVGAIANFSTTANYSGGVDSSSSGGSGGGGSSGGGGGGGGGGGW